MARSESWRILLVLVLNTPGWEVLQWDIKAAYLQADLKHEIYVKDLKEDGTYEFWQLHKALYGLKQAGHEWYNRMRGIMKSAGLTQCIGDPGCFKGPDIIVSTHVDDMAGYGTPAALAAFEKAEEKEVKLEKLGQPTKLLGMELTWETDNKLVKLTKKGCIDYMISEHQISTTPRHSIPLNPEGYAIPNESEIMSNQTKYQSLIGSLLYISRMTRPDISLHVNLLGRRTAKPGVNNLRAATQLAQYLASTKEEGLILKTDPQEVKIRAYADASYEGEGSRSQSGSLVTLFGIPVMWGSRRQDVASMSITEAEYIACSETAKDMRWIQQFLEEILETKEPIPATLFTDNEAALKLTKTQTYHRRTRHIEHWYHYIRQLVNLNQISVKGIPGKQNPADPFTKLLPMSSVGQWKMMNFIG